MFEPNATVPPPLRPVPAVTVTWVMAGTRLARPTVPAASWLLVTEPLAGVTFVKLEPLPTKALAVTVPLTCKALTGLFVPMPTPPLARMRKVLLAVELKVPPVPSAQTNAPLLSAWACCPAAKLLTPPATLLFPPGTVA